MKMLSDHSCVHKHSFQGPGDYGHSKRLLHVGSGGICVCQDFWLYVFKTNCLPLALEEITYKKE
jgi:hypothetical protein